MNEDINLRANGEMLRVMHANDTLATAVRTLQAELAAAKTENERLCANHRSNLRAVAEASFELETKLANLREAAEPALSEWDWEMLDAAIEASR